MEYDLAVKKKMEILPFVIDSMDGPGEYYAESDKPVRERQAPSDFIHTWNLMNKMN